MSNSGQQETMVKQIDADTLRNWLEEKRPVSLLDVRSDEERRQWSIPGSIHIDAHETLRDGQPGALVGAALPLDRPVVTICNAGRISQTAAEMLAKRGFDARSLAGGMKAWSVAWNTADVPLVDSAVRLIQVRRTGKGCLSYIVESGGAAAVIDPSVSPHVYVDITRERGWYIRYVIETHVHADHISQARELAGRTGAVLLLPTQNRTSFAFTPIVDGQRLQLGNASLVAVHTPGHTTESMSFIVNDGAVFTGDTLFTDGVGRPDLQADADAARARARALFRSIGRLRELRGDLVVLPAHASEPIAFDGVPVAARLADVDRWLTQWMASESAFVAHVTSNLPPPPPNVARIVHINETGEAAACDPTDLEAGANRCAVR